jgi:hypothetical protein
MAPGYCTVFTFREVLEPNHARYEGPKSRPWHELDRALRQAQKIAPSHPPNDDAEVEHAFRLLEPTKTTAAPAVPVQATKKRPIVDMPVYWRMPAAARR